MSPKAKNAMARTRVANKSIKAKPCAAARKRKASMKKPTRYSTKRSPKMRPGPQRRKPTRKTATKKRRARAPRCRLGLEDPVQTSPLGDVNEDQLPASIEG